MRFMKRLGEVLTPAPQAAVPEFATPMPRSSATPAPAAPSGLTAEDISAQLRMLVRAFIDMEAGDDHSRARARTQLTEIARSYGAYATAAKIRMVLESISRDPGRPERYDFERLHVLLGEFVFQHLFNEIAAMEMGQRQLGPNIFSTYCGDLIDALVIGRGPHAALEMGIHITERCLVNAADSREKRESYLQLADAAIRCTRDQLEHAMHRPSRHASASDAGSVGTEMTTLIRRKNQCIEYAREVTARVARIREELGALEQRPVLGRGELRALVSESQDTPNPALSPRLAAHLQYIQAALRVARSSEYLPFVAHVEERGARTLMARMRLEGPSSEVQQRCRAAYESAAQHLEAQGDRESALGLEPLSVQRYTKALELCTLAANSSQMSALQEKLATLGR